MNATPLAALVRRWVELYTRGLPAAQRATRRDEIDDDLWCQHEEAAAFGRSPRSLNAELFMRLLLGLPSDVSWRLSQGGRKGRAPVERSSSVSTRLFGALALIAGASWGTLVILVLAVGPELWSETNALLTPLTLLGAAGFAVAAVGLAWRFQDRLSPIGALGGVLAGLGVLSTFGAYAAIVLLPIGSAALAWELGRAGVLPRAVSLAHALSAVLFLVVVVRSQIDYAATIRSDLMIALAIPYMLSWMAIGASLVRGVPTAHEPAPGA